MKKVLMIAIVMMLASLGYGVTVDLTNDTLIVKDPSTALEAVTKNYVDKWALLPATTNVEPDVASLYDSGSAAKRLNSILSARWQVN